MKKLISSLIISLFIISSIIIFFILAWLFLPKNDLVTEQSNYKEYTRFISERSFSLKFQNDKDKNKYHGYGTGWILGSDTENKNKFYIATNLHVASLINNINKPNYYTFDKSKIKSNTNSFFDYLYFGQVINDNKIGTDNKFDRTTKTIYTSKIAIRNIDIEYTTIDYFNKMDIKNSNEIYYDKTIKNGVADFAIIGIDIRFREIINGYDGENDFFKKSFDNFLLNPTKFTRPNIKNKKYDDDLFIGGYSFNQKRDDDPSGAAWSNVNKIRSGYEISNTLDQIGKNWEKYYSLSGAHNINQFKKEFVLPDFIHYQTNEYASFINVSTQVTFEEQYYDYGKVLKPGSSGSMVINQNFEVVGIYWGSYEYSKYSKSVIDLFSNIPNSNNDNWININNIESYDILLDLKRAIKTININYSN